MSKDIFSILEKAHNVGFEQLSDVEILALLLNGGQEPITLAQYLLDHFQSLRQMATTSLEALLEVPGLSRARAIRLKAALVLGQHLSTISTTERPTIERPSDMIKLLQPHLQDLPQEQVVSVLLDSHNRVIDMETIYIGSLSTTAVRVAEVFRSAIIRNCAGLILAHNHPSGDATPSSEDISFTQALVTAGKVLDIAVLDHLIIGKGEWISMRERNLGFSTQR